MEFYPTNPGPLDLSVLYDQDKHISSAIWEGQERTALRCHEHTSKLDQWILTDEQIELVKKAGFYYLRLLPSISLDNPLISALVERWRRETNTFHMNVGEMTITLEDVAYLIGLPIDGEAVIGVTYTSCIEVCVKYFGIVPEPKYISGGMVKLSWLREKFSNCPKDASVKEIENCTRAYLLYLIGSTIFSTTTGNKVPVMYVPLFEDFNKAGTYAWGAAALSFLYRSLGNASLKTQNTISGCLTLLQCWSYYHFNVGRPRLYHEPIHECFPFVLRWKGKQSCPTANRDVAFYRKAFDLLKPCDVDWCPYVNISRTVIPENILKDVIMGRSKTILICFDKAERHVPDRCLRQFGMSQSIPNDVLKWERKSRGVDGGVNLSMKMQSEVEEWGKRRFNIIEAETTEEDTYTVTDTDTEESEKEKEKEKEYFQWYSKITRLIIGRPFPISVEYQRMSVALKEIAELVDNVSTNGMDDVQVDTISRIRYVVHEGLGDHSSSFLVARKEEEEENGRKVLKGVKERVRRGRGRGGGKRKRKEEDDEIYYQEVVEEEEEEEEENLFHIDDPNLCIRADDIYDDNSLFVTQQCVQNGEEEEDDDEEEEDEYVEIV